MKSTTHGPENQTKGGNPALREMEKHIDDLPLLPQVLVRILQLDASSEDYFQQFENMAMEDPAFAVRVVALANSASSAPVAPIDTIRGALTRLGAGTIAGFVASLSVQRVFVPREPAQIRLWKHSIETAVAAQRIAQIATSLGVDPGQAYLAGLLHDIGRFVMLEHAAPELREVEASNWHTPEELVEADIDVYTFTHSELGFLACNRWGLPDTIAAAVRAHHDEPPEVIEAGSVDAGIFCVQVADRISISLLQQPDELYQAEAEALVRSECLPFESAHSIISASAIAAELAAIRDESDRLFENLGFG